MLLLPPPELPRWMPRHPSTNPILSFALSTSSALSSSSPSSWFCIILFLYGGARTGLVKPGSGKVELPIATLPGEANRGCFFLLGPFEQNNQGLQFRVVQRSTIVSCEQHGGHQREGKPSNDCMYLQRFCQLVCTFGGKQPIGGTQISNIRYGGYT